MTKRTTAITDAMIEAAALEFGRQHSNVCYPVAMDFEANLAAEAILKAAMQSATPSTPELGELVEQDEQIRVVANALLSTLILAKPDLTDEDVDNLARAALEAAGISSIQKEIDTKTAALRAARVIIVEDANACRAFRHESEGPSGPENVLAKIDAALSSKGGVS